jgi:hypothetical protein
VRAGDAPMWHKCGTPREASICPTAESACLPGLDPMVVWPAEMGRKPPATCDCALSGSDRLAADHDAMCPECARPGRAKIATRTSFPEWRSAGPGREEQAMRYLLTVPPDEVATLARWVVEGDLL